jgi:Ca-activated chloride channel homolog
MSGTPIQQAKIAFTDMIEQLNPEDYFNVVEFDTTANRLWLNCRAASSSNIESAIEWVANRDASGSTNLYGGVDKGLRSFKDDNLPKVMLVLSDGLPNSGTYTTPATIGPAIIEANTLGVSISTIAFTNYVNLDFMAGIASDNNGYFTYITPDSEASTKILDFYATLAVEGLQEYNIDISGATDYAHFKPMPEGMLVNGSEILMTGRYLSQIAFSTTLQYEEEIVHYFNNETTPGTEHQHMETLWAQQRIAYLETQINNGEEQYKNELVQLGMYYGLVIQGYTAMIITTEDAESPMEDGGIYDDGLMASGGMGVPSYPIPIFIGIVAISLGLLMKKFFRKEI